MNIEDIKYEDVDGVLTSPRMAELNILEEGLPVMIGVFSEGRKSHTEIMYIPLEETDEGFIERYKNLLITFNNRRSAGQKKRKFIRAYRLLNVIRAIKI